MRQSDTAHAIAATTRYARQVVNEDKHLVWFNTGSGLSLGTILHRTDDNETAIIIVSLLNVKNPESVNVVHRLAAAPDWYKQMSQRG